MHFTIKRHFLPISYSICPFAYISLKVFIIRKKSYLAALINLIVYLFIIHFIYLKYMCPLKRGLPWHLSLQLSNNTVKAESFCKFKSKNCNSFCKMWHCHKSILSLFIFCIECSRWTNFIILTSSGSKFFFRVSVYLNQSLCFKVSFDFLECELIQWKWNYMKSYATVQRIS